MVASGSSSRKYGLRSGTLIARNATLNNNLTVQGNLNFGDATTDNLLVNGTSTFMATMNIDAMMDIDSSSTAANAIVDIAQTGTGVGVFINMDNTLTAANNSLLIDDESTGNTNAVIKINSKKTGAHVSLTAEGAGAAASTVVSLAATNASNSSAMLFLDQDGTATGVEEVFEIDDQCTGNTKAAVVIASARTGTVVMFDAEAATAAQAVEIQLASTGSGLLIDANATGVSGAALQIDDESTGSTVAALIVDTLKTGAAVQIVGTATGVALDIRNSVATTATNFATTSTVGVIKVLIGGLSTQYFIPVISTYA